MGKRANLVAPSTSGDFSPPLPNRAVVLLAIAMTDIALARS
jgi:hypothetical protein